MKKAIALLLVVLLAATAVFAGAEGNTVTVKSIVGKITLAQANDKAGDDGASGLYTLYVNNSDTYTGDNIATADVVASFKIVQNAETRTDEGIRLDVTATPLSFDNHDSNAAAIDTFTAVVASTDCAITNSITGNALQVNLVYQGVAKPVAKDQVICTFKATWPQTAGLAAYPGTYVSNIVLAYTIV